ncbi:hypothetical protein LCGC14_0577340 [marine sediment metagenome]|uniref:Acylneuraminate cytidylyltransferase n=1 Tax=marine sediment metagenome TaxID=412755 RepID=A0A0F9U3R6_9ZZZZ|nr:acylneuraminate cytidylyltransferase [bacterium]
MKGTKVGVIVQARMGSTRLPNKVLKKLYKNDRVLDVLIKRLKLSKKLNEIIIATTTDIKDKVIIEVANNHNVSSFVGDEENVLLRYYEASKKFNLDIIIRVTSDCPFIDPKVLDDMIEFYKNQNYDYIRNVDETTNFSRGFEIEIFNIEVLKEIFSRAETKPEKEHVTFYIYTHPEKFTLYSYNIENLKKFENLRLTIDEEDDLLICRVVYKKLIEKGKNYDFSIYDIIELIEKNPSLMDINKHVQHKKV